MRENTRHSNARLHAHNRRTTYQHQYSFTYTPLRLKFINSGITSSNHSCADCSVHLQHDTKKRLTAQGLRLLNLKSCFRHVFKWHLVSQNQAHSASQRARARVGTTMCLVAHLGLSELRFEALPVLSQRLHGALRRLVVHLPDTPPAQPDLFPPHTQAVHKLQSRDSTYTPCGRHSSKTKKTS